MHPAALHTHYALMNTPATEITIPVTSSSFSGIEWVKQCITQYPEICYLADRDVRHTEEGIASLQGTYSEQLYGEKFIEFDRTIMTLHCLRLILTGGDEAYQEFIAAQKEGTLTRNSFDALHRQGQDLLDSQYENLSPSQIRYAMETALVLGDIGKSAKGRLIFGKYGAKAPDHDDFHEEMMLLLSQDSSLSPSFHGLPKAAQALLVKVANLAHFGHITHLEGGPGMFTKLKKRKPPERELSFALFVHTCDVAGALGHVNNSSSLVYTEPTHRSMQAMQQAVFVLNESVKTEKDAYDVYMNIRAEWLGIDPSEPLNRVATRVGAMLRLFTPDEGITLRKAISTFSPTDLDLIISQLDQQVEPENEGPTPTYIPAVLVNLSNHPLLGESKEGRLGIAVVTALPFIARVLKRHQENLEKGRADPSIPLNFNPIAETVKRTPFELLLRDFYITMDGCVYIQNVTLSS